jgi:alanine-synthesizing transaminase
VFSQRLPARLEPNAISAAVGRAREAGRPLLDLTVTNPTIVDLPFAAGVLAPLAGEAATTYRPEPFGWGPARDAVARDFARRRLDVPSGRVVLASSTSEAYSLLFKLLCDPADEVLVPQPSYPLFEHLSALDGVRAVPYPLEYHGLWSPNRDAVRRAWSPRTRAVLVVAPNNPTGSMHRADDLAWIAGECAARGASLVSDEVFADYPIDPAPGAASSILEGRPPGSTAVEVPGFLAFVLGGLSKSAALPQIKVGWIAVAGDSSLVDAALARLELICDMYLSVSTPAQVALPALLAAGALRRAVVAERLARNHRAMQEVVARFPACTALRVEGGWSAVVRVPAHRREESLVEMLVERDAVLVHPGYFFDFRHEAFVVVSLLPPEPVFREAIERVCRRASA